MAKKQQSGATGKSQTGLRESYGRAKQANWTNADAEQLRSAVAAAAKSGGALRLGYSRDGGAFAVGVYGDGDPYTLYLPPDDDIDSLLARIESAFGEIA